jgi:hypothetical protein
MKMNIHRLTSTSHEDEYTQTNDTSYEDEYTQTNEYFT